MSCASSVVHWPPLATAVPRNRVKERLRQRASELGFGMCGIASAEAPATAGAFRSWLERGFQGEMAYLSRRADERADLQRVLPGARSVVAVAAGYSGGEPGDTGAGDGPGLGTGHSPTRGWVARYARYRDYHEVCGEKLEELARWLAREAGPGVRVRAFVDTGPVLERELAQRAGVGFVGKHTNLIGRRGGNWLFLGEILTTVELNPDPPERNRCGRCARCLAACPTGAIVAPFQLDARRCLSYLTIEHKGPIPEDLRPALGRRIYGCDDCLEACPWNRFAMAGGLMGAEVRPELAEPDLLELVALDAAGFRRRFAGTSLLRSRRRGLLRNVCVALGNVGGAEALVALDRAAADPEPLIAEHARWAGDRIRARCGLKVASGPGVGGAGRADSTRVQGLGSPG
jgi:epoxyqueuosine reductase